jgi:hypothetical protein
MADDVIELARREQTECRRLDLLLKNDGANALQGQHMQPGDSDDE